MHQYDHGGDVYGADCPSLDFSISLNPMGPPPAIRTPSAGPSGRRPPGGIGRRRSSSSLETGPPT